MTSTNRVSSSGDPAKLKVIQLEHAESLGANAHKGKKLEANQISAKQRVKSLDKDIKGSGHENTPHLSVVATHGFNKNSENSDHGFNKNSENFYHGFNKNSENSDHDLKDTISEEAVDSYADGTWQIVKSKKSHN